jgi:S-formylglutathione hydrolase
MSVVSVSLYRSHGGMQGVYKHSSRQTGTGMTFSVYVPPHQDDAKLPVVWYLSGLTCTHANVTEKGEFRKACAELGLIFVAPDTSPRGEGVPGDAAGAYDFGLGAGFYVDATQPPFARNYRMWSLSEPSSAFETQVKHCAKQGDNANDDKVAVLRLQLGHIFEIHAVNPGDRGGHGQYRGPSG